MLTDHHQLVRFNITPVRNSVITPEKRLRNRIRVRCSRWPPLAMWASWVLHNTFFKGFIICLIFLNMLVLMVKSEVMDKLDARLVSLKLSLEVTVWVILLIFIIEILLNWIVSFRDFWKSSWNVFDFSVTVVSVIPEFLGLAGITNSIAAMRIIRAFRVLRTLKLFSKFHQVRVIILAIAKTLKAMIFILLLFLFFFYVFAVSGIFFFESYSRSDRTDLEYSMYFRDFPNTLVTLFILFTMDHWYALLQDTWKIPEMSKVISSLYIILWLLVGSFMFRNIFVAITVTNFQTIRSDLAEEVKKIETQKKADLFKMQIRDSKLLGASLQQVPGGERGAGSRRRGSPSGAAVGVQGGDKAEHEGLGLGDVHPSEPAEPGGGGRGRAGGVAQRLPLPLLGAAGAAAAQPGGAQEAAALCSHGPAEPGGQVGGLVMGLPATSEPFSPGRSQHCRELQNGLQDAPRPASQPQAPSAALGGPKTRARLNRKALALALLAAWGDHSCFSLAPPSPAVAAPLPAPLGVLI
ncbi:cation channel sperm-associated protein 2 isoform X2 [Pelodiscus sinensis]